MIGPGPSIAPRRGIADPQWDRQRQELHATWDWQQRVAIIGLSGQNTAGGNVTLRFRASRATLFVQVHVQTDAVGEGGATYDPANFHSSELVDCRENRQQDYVIGRGAGAHYYVWLIPVFEDPGGTTVKFDGVDAAEDYAAFLDLGV